MNDKAYKKYVSSARRGVKGEAFFETLVSDYCIPHRIVGLKDVGIDYFCEWVYGDKPTGVLFGVQVKTFSASSASSIKALDAQDQNGLDLYEIRYSKLLKVEEKTYVYWRGLGMPIYLFAIVEDATGELSCYYKRYTPFLTLKRQEQSFNYYAGFCKVNDGMTFVAFKYPEAKQLGFARDLYVDYMRCCYSKGIVAYLNPNDIGLNQFTQKGLDLENVVFKDLFEEYAEEIYLMYFKIQGYLKHREEPNPSSGDCSLYVGTTGWGLDGDVE